MSNWTEEYLWDRQEKEQEFHEAFMKSKYGQLYIALINYIMDEMRK